METLLDSPEKGNPELFPGRLCENEMLLNKSVLLEISRRIFCKFSSEAPQIIESISLMYATCKTPFLTTDYKTFDTLHLAMNRLGFGCNPLSNNLGSKKGE